MSRRNLEHLFRPRSVAVIGASDRPHSVGATVMSNLLDGGFSGPVWPVNLRREKVAGRTAYPRVADLPGIPDLAIVCTPAPGIPGLISELGQLGTRAAIVVSGGLEAIEHGETLERAMLKAAAPFNLRILGPNCIGLLVPSIGLNASFAHCGARPGNVAFVAQSGALTTAMLDWARTAQVGFSCFVSLGSAADIDFGDLLDQLGRDPETRAILLYVESITSPRKFMSAARSAARNKPVIVVKSGRTGESAQAAHSHSGALAGSDAVYDAAFRRAGILRVDTTRQLFDAAAMLARSKPYVGPRLAIVSNGGGPGVMATDALITEGGELARLAPETLRRLDGLLPARWSHANPIDIGGDALPERYVGTLQAVLADPHVDALLVIHAPTAVASVAAVAVACGPELESARAPALACWLGSEEVVSRAVREGSAYPVYSTPEEAVDSFLNLVRYSQSQALLTEVPASIPEEPVPDAGAARTIVAAALAAGRTILTEPETKRLLSAYHIPVVETRIVEEVADLPSAAAAIGYPVVLKILSSDISHKSDVGGVALNLTSDEDIKAAARSMLARCRELAPSAMIEGFTVQKMVKRGGAHELLAGIALDATFGPTVVFGQGGTAVEVVRDRALALPPLNSALARDLIAQTRVQRLLRGYRGRHTIDMRALEQTLVKLARLVVDLPELVELDINPLLADEHGVLALDARARVQASSLAGLDRLAIRPYPSELEERAVLRGRALLLRPIRPEDFAAHGRLLAQISPEDLHSRFLAGIRELPQRDLAHLTQIDYEREMAFIARSQDPGEEGEILGVARASTDPENLEADFAVLVRSNLKGQGLGRLLLEKLIAYCRSRGTHRMTGQVSEDNAAMLHLARRLGFAVGVSHRGIVDISLTL